MIIVIDNYDSFTYNLVQYLGESGGDLRVYRNDQVTIPDLRALDPTHMVVSPGPGRPSDGGISIRSIRELGPHVPTLGVCLGHQAIASAFGGEVRSAPRLMHGKTSLVHHLRDELFSGLPNPFVAARYHSLIVSEPLPSSLERIAYTSEGELMGLRHKKYPIYGVQFHPESILTEYGKMLLNNFLIMGKNWVENHSEVQHQEYQGGLR